MGDLKDLKIIPSLRSEKDVPIYLDDPKFTNSREPVAIPPIWDAKAFIDELKTASIRHNSAVDPVHIYVVGPKGPKSADPLLKIVIVSTRVNIKGEESEKRKPVLFLQAYYVPFSYLN